MSIIRKILAGLSITCSCTMLHAQNMSNPYSIYELGDIDFRHYNRTAGMGHTGIAFHSNTSFVDNNPASITSLIKSVYLVNVAATGKSVTYKGDPIGLDNSNSKDFWIKRFTLALKLNNFWASGIGYRQFSNMNYKFTGNKTIEGSNQTVSTIYEGDGGLHEYFWTNAFAVGKKKRLSFGVRSSLIAGGLNHSEIIADASLPNTFTTQIQDYVGKLRFQGGVLYRKPVSKKWDIAIGATYAPASNITSERTVTVLEGSSEVNSNEFTGNKVFHLPKTYGVGLSATKNNKTTYALDFVHEDWASFKVKETGWQLVNSNRISGGINFSQFNFTRNGVVEKRNFQVGSFFNQSYLQIRNKPIYEYGITAGIGGILGQGLLYNIALEGGSRGTTQQKLIKENYVQLTLSFTYRDILYTKGKKYD